MRSLDALLRNPEPFIGAPLRRALELVIFGMSALLALSFRQKPVLQVATALMLLSRACADVPAFGLFLATGALLCNLGSFSEHGAARIS
jgi:hypothetical protein